MYKKIRISKKINAPEIFKKHGVYFKVLSIVNHRLIIDDEKIEHSECIAKARSKSKRFNLFSYPDYNSFGGARSIKQLIKTHGKGIVKGSKMW